MAILIETNFLTHDIILPVTSYLTCNKNIAPVVLSSLTYDKLLHL